MKRIASYNTPQNKVYASVDEIRVERLPSASSKIGIQPRLAMLNVALVIFASAMFAHDVLCASPPIPANSLDQYAIGSWTRGRSTFYGDGDGYSIDSGACHYGGIPSPYYVAALSDWWSDYKCGSCFELQCDPNGRSYCRSDRLSASVVVKITDRCPCDHPNPSNKKWCCGDMPHFDMSYQAFGEIASHTGGWVYLQWREIQCPPDIGLGGELLTGEDNSYDYCDGSADENLVQVAEDYNLTLFLDALQRAGPEVYNAVNDTSSQHSVLAPTNKAFQNLAGDLGISVDKLLDEPSLHEMMKYHILKENVDFQNLDVNDTFCDDVPPRNYTCQEEKEMGNCGATYEEARWCLQTCGSCETNYEKFTTMGDVDITLGLSSSGNATEAVIDKGNIRLQLANITKELKSCNGNLAVVDDVLFSMCQSSKSKDLVRVAQEAGLYRFTEAVWKADIFSADSLGIGRNQGLYTALAPTDKAFEAAIQKLKLPDFEAFLNREDLVSIMQNHVIKGKFHLGNDSFESLSAHPINISPSHKSISNNMRNFTVDSGKESPYTVNLDLGNNRDERNKMPQTDVLVLDLDACDGFLDIVDTVLI